MRSIWSLMIASLSEMNVSVDGMYAFRLVVVVLADEVLDRVLGKELARISP